MLELVSAGWGPTQLLSRILSLVQQVSGLVMYSSINFKSCLFRLLSISPKGFKILYQSGPITQMLREPH
jgi:hypothetical protein